MTLRVGILRDHSASMHALTDIAREDFNKLIHELQLGSNEFLDVSASVIECPGRISFINTPIESVKPLTTYGAWGGNTPLYRDVNTLIGQISNLYTSDDVVLVLVLTDGADNGSTSYDVMMFRENMTRLKATDRWTFAFRVPDSIARDRLIQNGVPSGNIQVWETTKKGLEESSVLTRSAVANYTASVASGASTSTDKFYANLSNVSLTDVKSTLRDISQEVLILPVSGAEGQQIRAFVEGRIGRAMKKGAAFYQLMKTEPKVQDYKKIIIRSKTSNAIYEGIAARNLLGVPHTGTIKLAPGQHGDFDIFIQSTSVNRSLDKNSQVIYWENTGSDYKTGVSSSSSSAVPPATTSQPASSVFHTPAHKVSPTSTTKAPKKQAPAKKVIAPTVALKKTPAVNALIAAATGKVPAKKVRVRNRDTVQERVRKFIAKTFNLTQKSVKNTIEIGALTGNKYWRDVFPWYKFNLEFGTSLVPSNLHEPISVGTFIDKVILSVNKIK